LGGAGLVQDYNNSPSGLLTSVLPELGLLPWKFEKLPKNFWESPKNAKIFMDWAKIELKVNKMSDWYNVTEKVRTNPQFLLTLRILPHLMVVCYYKNMIILSTKY
jgi:hypothetical protein